MMAGESEEAARGNEPLSGVRQRSEERFQQLVEDLQVGVLLQGPSSEVLFCNRAALEMLGVTAEQIVGKPALEATPLAVHEDGTPFPGTDHPASQAIATGRPVHNVVMGFHR